MFCFSLASAFIRVSITLSTLEKHTLPVKPTCPWWHQNSVVSHGTGCKFVGSGKYQRPVENYHDVWQCVRESACSPTDESLQMVILRDPRPMTVSSYYHQLIYYRQREGTIDEYVEKMLPTMCQWVALRHILFEGESYPGFHGCGGWRMGLARKRALLAKMRIR